MGPAAQAPAPDAGPTLPRHLYVHVPLCRSKCAYCDFFSMPASEAPAAPGAIADALLNQARAWEARGLRTAGVDTIYLGGGTPTVLGDLLPALVNALAVWAEAAPGAEITVEANPDSLDVGLLETLAMAGATRMSLGVQSLVDDELVAIGRPHSAARARAAAAEVLDVGLDLSVDLMCGLPGQTLESWKRSVTGAIALEAGHVSVYPLSLEEGTPLARSVAGGVVAVPDADEVADMLTAGAALLADAGLQRYEVASHARRGHESRHNTAYWTGREYLGVGPGAHGMLNASTARAAGMVAPEGVTRVRYAIDRDLVSGLAVMPTTELELLGADEAAREDAMLGLRMADGITDQLAEEANVSEALASLERDGLVRHAAGRWATTERGWLLGNEVFGRVWAG